MFWGLHFWGKLICSPALNACIRFAVPRRTSASPLAKFHTLTLRSSPLSWKSATNWWRGWRTQTPTTAEWALELFRRWLWATGCCSDYRFLWNWDWQSWSYFQAGSSCCSTVPETDCTFCLLHAAWSATARVTFPNRPFTTRAPRCSTSDTHFRR